MRIGYCGSPTDSASGAEAGFDYVEANVQAFLIPESPDEQFAANLAQAKESALPVLAANCFLPGALRSTGDQVDLDRILAYSLAAFRRAQQVGIRKIVFGSGGSRKLDEKTTPQQADEQFVNLLLQLSPIAEQFDVIVVLEPLRRQECNYINTVAEGAKIIEAVDHPNIRLLADFYHMLQNGEDPADLATYGKLISHCHLAEKRERTCPGVDGDDFVPFFKALAEAGYNDTLSFEGKFPEGMAVDGEQAVQVMRSQLAEAGL